MCLLFLWHIVLTVLFRFIDIPDIKRRATSLHNQLHLPTVRKSKQARVHTVAPTSQRFFVGSSNKKAKLIVLQITGLHDESTKKMCEEALLQVYWTLDGKWDTCFYMSPLLNFVLLFRFVVWSVLHLIWQNTGVWYVWYKQWVEKCCVKQLKKPKY